MGLLTKEVEVYLGNGAIRRYEELGYKIPRVEKFIITQMAILVIEGTVFQEELI